MQNKNLRVRRIYDDKNKVRRGRRGFAAEPPPQPPRSIELPHGARPETNTPPPARPHRQLDTPLPCPAAAAPPHLQVVLYVAYSTRFTGAADEKDVSTSRYRTSVCAVPVAAAALVPVAAEAAVAAAE